MGSGGVGASARTGNHFKLSCDSSEWSMMLRPLTTSVVLFMESTFFLFFRVTISGNMSQTATACLWRRGFLFQEEVVFCQQHYVPAILSSFGRGDGGRFKRPASCGSGSVHQTWLRPSILNTIYPILKGPIVKKRENDGRMPRRPRCRRACCIFLSNPAISMSTLLNGWVTYILNSCFSN